MISNPAVGYVFLTLVCGAFLVEAITFIPHDFSNYYLSATLLKNGAFSTSVYFPHVFNTEIAQMGYEGVFGSYAPNTPFLATFFAPFTYVSLGAAKIIFNLLSLFLFVYSAYRLVSTFKIRTFYLFAIPIIFIIPLRNSFLFGQVYLLLFFLLSEGFLAYRKGKHIKMGLFWGIAILLKVFPLLLFGFLLFKKKYKAIMYLALVCIVLLAVSVLIQGVEVWEFYFSAVLPRAGNGEITLEFVQNYQSVFMFLKGVFASDAFLFTMVLFVFKMLLLILSYFVTRKERSLLKLFSFWMVLSILLSPYGSTYTNILLLFPMLFFVRGKRLTPKTFVILGVFFLICNLPVDRFSELSLPWSFPRLGLLLILIAILFRNNLKQVSWKWVVAILLPAGIIYGFFQTPKEQTEEFTVITPDEHILKYDYSVKEGTLVYYYWNQKGRNEGATELSVRSIDSLSVTLIDNQVFYKNEQLTFEDGNKHKPALINGNTVVYFSDDGRGIGFYQLRAIDVQSDKTF